MKKFFALAVMLFFAVIAWTPILAVANGADDPAVAVSEAVKNGASRLFGAYASAYVDETTGKEALVKKVAALEQEVGLYKATAKMLQTAENTPISMKYLGQERRLSGNYEVTEYTYLLHNDERHAVLAIGAATALAERDLVELHLSKIAEKEACGAKSERCDNATAKWRLKNSQAQESYNSALKTIKMFVP